MQRLIHEETAFALFRLRRSYFESGDKAGKMLAHRLKCIENRQIIPAIRDENGMLQCDAVSINESFKNYYSKLYSAESCVNDTEMDGVFLFCFLKVLICRGSVQLIWMLLTPLIQIEIKTQ